MFEQPDVGGIANPRTTDDEISDGSETTRSPGNMREVSVHERVCEISHSGRGDLPRRRAENVHTGLPALGKNGTKRPTEGSCNQTEGRDKLAVSETARLQIRPHEYKQADDPQRKSSFASSRNVMVAEQKGIEHKKPERCNRDDQRR